MKKVKRLLAIVSDADNIHFFNAFICFCCLEL